MTATNTSIVVGTTPTMLFSPIASSKKAIINTNLANSNTSTGVLVSLYAIPTGQSTSSPPLLSFIGGMPLSTFGTINANQQRTGDVLTVGYSLYATANATGIVAFVAAETFTDV